MIMFDVQFIYGVNQDHVIIQSIKQLALIL
jgi:hypothetical protein